VRQGSRARIIAVAKGRAAARDYGERVNAGVRTIFRAGRNGLVWSILDAWFLGPVYGIKHRGTEPRRHRDEKTGGQGDEEPHAKAQREKTPRTLGARGELRITREGTRH